MLTKGKAMERLRMIKYPCFLLLQEMFYYRGISIIDAYLHGISETTLKSYKSGCKTFIYFLVEENYNNNDWEDRNLCQEICLEFLNWGFVGKEVTPASLNIVCSSISKFFTILLQILILLYQISSKISKDKKKNRKN
jgi:hypothetical protein